MVEVSIKSEDVDNLVRAIREHADSKALKKELYGGLNSVTKEVRADMKANVNPFTTPTSGGLTALMVGSTRFSAYAKPGRYAAVGIKVRGRGSLAAMNFKGSFRHPVRNSGEWVSQSAGVRKGLLTEPFQDSKPKVQHAIEEVLDGVARKVTNI